MLRTSPILTISETKAVAAPHWRNSALFAAFFGLTVLLQFLSGAYRSEFAGYPDESAHYVTSVMVRDFIAGFHYTEPMKFAEDYYAHYPKVAFGHWPPLFYVITGLWMLLLSKSRLSVLMELALLTSVLAWMTYSTVKRHFGWKAGACAGFFLICLPIVQIYSDEVMAESLLTITSLAAALSFARYLESNHWKDSAWFGVFASLAILTKGSGWDLALVPLVALALTRNFALLRTYSFWLPAVIVFSICAPWQILTLHSVQHGWTGGDHPTLQYTLESAGPLFGLLFTLLGWAMAPLLAIGIAVTVIIPYFRKCVHPGWATMVALVFADWIFHAIVPAGVEDRKLIVAVPALVLFLFAGGWWVVGKFRWNPAAVMLGALALFGLEKFSVPKEIHYGYSEAANFIRQHQNLPGRVILVSSERDGEGMLVSEIAMGDTRPTHYILRATKVLASVDWNGTVFDCYYRTPESLMNYLKREKVDLVVSDTLPPLASFEHQQVLNQAIAKYPAQLRLIASFHGDLPGATNIYRVD